ncbi:protection of telomeres protein 1 [Plakobranchus ocellatus]|uniref:Protection of telomeres protein 1 n=1 Tax=Plakobranchus ocellatus TaxID=259542 RepID=A0AAV3ZK92_9GAST|nr:protection of telomeres protein 1 [Plakobranchus ocellatus]
MSCLCKTLERMVNDRLVHVLRPRNLLSKVQCGFRKDHSTLDYLISKAIGSPASISSAHNVELQELVAEKRPESTRQGKCRTYNYRILSEVKVNSIVDVYGVVKFVKPTVKGKGSDYYCVVGLVDPSLSTREEEKLTCVFFNREHDKLPEVQEGDVLRLHRLKIQSYQGGKQGYNGPGFQWLAFHRSLDSITFSSAFYTFEDQDKETVTELFDWWSKICDQEITSLPATKNSGNQRITFADVLPKRYFDIVCQVVQVCVLDPGICRLIRVWDGTKFEGHVKDVADGELNNSLIEDKLLVEASRGLTIDIFLFDDHAKDSDCIKPEDYLLLTNVHSAVVSGLVEMTIHGGGLNFGRGFQVLSVNDLEIQALKARLNPIVKRFVESPSHSCFQSQRANKDRICEMSKNRHSVDNINALGSYEDNDNNNDEVRIKDSIDRASPFVNKLGTFEDDQYHAFSRRKDIPSKNKTLRNRIRYNTANIDGDADEHSDKALRNKNWAPGKHGRKSFVAVKSFLNHTEDDGFSFWTAAENDESQKEDQSASSDDNSQSIWLSIYNENNSGSKETKVVSTSVHHVPKQSNEVLYPIEAFIRSSNENTLETSTKDICVPERPTEKEPTKASNELTADDFLEDTGRIGQQFAKGNESSSQESFVTVPSPNHQTIAPNPCQINDNLGVSKNLEEGQRNALKRQGDGLRNASDKRVKLSSQIHEEKVKTNNSKKVEKCVEREHGEDGLKSSCSNRKDEFLLIESGKEKVSRCTENEFVEIDEDKTYNDNEEGGEEVEIHETFSQKHLEILDSNTLNFETEEFSQASNTKDLKEAKSNQETDLSSYKQIEKNDQQPITKRKRGRPRKIKSPDVQEQSLCSSKQSSVHNKKDELQNSPCREGTQDIERSQSSCQDQEFPQVEIGDSQVSSSTDSLKSQSQSRCMLRTASVVLNHTDVAKSSLQEVLKHTPPHKFRIQARVERIEPRPVGPRDLVHFLCKQCKFFKRMSSPDDPTLPFHTDTVSCPRCTQSPATLRPVTVLVLQLSDGCNTISASVWDKNADQFFGGLTAHQLLTNRDSFCQVQEWLTNLCPLGTSLEDRPVLECCVCSYYVEGDVKIQIFDTSLV